MSVFLANEAKKLGDNKTIMDSYWKYHEGEYNWFFSPNSNLDNAERRPYSFPSSDLWNKLKSSERKEKWKRFSLKQRMTLAALAGFGYEGRGINLDNSHHFNKLREAFLS